MGINLSTIDGYIYKIEYDSIHKLINEYFNDQQSSIEVLEIGSWKGKSSLMFLQANPKVRVTAIEPFCGPPEVFKLYGVNTKEDYLHNTSLYSDRITLIEKYSTDSSLHLDLKDQQFDIFFIDGDHSYSGVINDIRLALRYTKDNGLIMIDDFWINAAKNFKFRGITDAVHDLLMYKCKFLYLYRSVIVFQKNKNFTTY